MLYMDLMMSYKIFIILKVLTIIISSFQPLLDLIIILVFLIILFLFFHLFYFFLLAISATFKLTKFIKSYFPRLYFSTFNLTRKYFNSISEYIRICLICIFPNLKQNLPLFRRSKYSINFKRHIKLFKRISCFLQK